MKSQNKLYIACALIAVITTLVVWLLIDKIKAFRHLTKNDLERQGPSVFESITHDIKQTMQEITSNNYFTIEELCKSNTAKQYNLDNTPTLLIEAALQNLIDKVLNPAREEYGSAIYVHSGYRSPEVNAKVGGVATSQHLTGEAADIDTFSRKNNAKVFEIIINQRNYDQLIWEKNGQWIHVSCKKDGNNRKSILQYKNGVYSHIESNWKQVIA